MATVTGAAQGSLFEREEPSGGWQRELLQRQQAAIAKREAKNSVDVRIDPAEAIIRKLEAVEFTRLDDSALAGFMMMMQTDVPSLKKFGLRVREETERGKICEAGAALLRELYSIQMQKLREAERAKRSR